MKGLRALEKKIVDSVDQIEIDKENTIEKLKRDEIEGSIAFGSEWMVLVYDFGELIYPSSIRQDRAHRWVPQVRDLHVRPHTHSCISPHIWNTYSYVGLVIRFESPPCVA